MALTVQEIVGLFEAKGSAWYGNERVSQLEHAMQCAQLAERAGAAPTLVVASFLHDLGHLLIEADNLDPNVDDVHQYLAIPFLRGVFPDAVLEPMRLHVDAKRYLCFADQDYWDTLSHASKLSLELQGGVFTAGEAQKFLNNKYARDAVNLRIWDDLAKVPAAHTPGLTHYGRLLVDQSMPNGKGPENAFA